MTFSLIGAHPFGTEIPLSAIISRFDALSSWEDRYRALILLGKHLPTLNEADKCPEILLKGCEDPAWLGYQRMPDGGLHFYADTQGRVLRGLLSVLLTVIEGQTPEQLLTQDPLKIFDDLKLKNVLSASRANGLNVLARAIKAAALKAAEN